MFCYFREAGNRIKIVFLISKEIKKIIGYLCKTSQIEKWLVFGCLVLVPLLGRLSGGNQQNRRDIS